LSNAFDSAAAFYTLRLKVFSLTSNIDMSNFNTNCGTYLTLPGGTQVANSDLHIYVTGYNDSATASAVASGIPCVFVGGSLPDVTNSVGRPVAGLIRMNVNSYSSTTSYPSSLYATLIGTIVHELTHVLGFGSSYFSTFINTGTNNVYASTTATVTNTRNSTSITNTVLTTPNVLAWARSHYNCATLTGMQLENQGGAGTAGSHWERMVSYDELMTGTQLGLVKPYSALTFAILKDMGWYDVTDTFAEKTTFGYQRGCTFFDQGCWGGSYPAEYCSTESAQGCTQSNVGKGQCTNTTNLLADSCLMTIESISCVNPSDFSKDGTYSYTQESYSASSQCFVSSAATVSIPGLNARCYEYNCSSDNTQILIKIGSNTYTCTTAGTTFVVSGMSGSVTCPSPTDFCTNRRIFCPDFCSGNGYCMGGICNCKTGFAGASCSITSCSSTQYYHSVSGTCVGTCPSGTFANVFNKNCDACKSPCTDCAVTPDACTACPGGTRVLHLGTCISNCPTGFWNSSGVCTACDNSCKECSGSTANDCTSCPSSSGTCTTYLSSTTVPSPTVGNCIAICTGTNNHADQTNCRCLQNNCPFNQIRTANASTNFLCNLCPTNQFYNTASTSCVVAASCAAGTFARTSDRFCAQCFSSTCLTCNGILSTNCLTCQSATPFLYLGACVISTACGMGTYPDTVPSPQTCSFCPAGCSTCTSSAVCTSCFGPTTAAPTGYYQSGNACVTSCSSTQYKNEAKRTCVGCDSSCATCDSTKSTGCTSCSGSAYLFSNQSGTYCLQLCPTLGYYPDPSNTCKRCHVTCRTCSGTLSTNCNSCSGNYFLYSSQCVYFCPKKFYRNLANNNCLACHADCDYCFAAGDSGCLSCATGKFLNATSCLTTCPNNTKANAFGVCWGQILVALAVMLLAGL
jgi:proprotein convertase subtilisin/kexin type 5